MTPLQMLQSVFILLVVSLQSAYSLVTYSLEDYDSTQYVISSTFKTTQYDTEFRKYTKQFIPGLDWRLIKAQCHTESHFREDAVSPVGAIGLCQFMPGTWSDVQDRLRMVASPLTPEMNIMFAAYYMGSLRRSWKVERPEFDRHSLAMASYNAGLGNILKSQKKCGNLNLYYPTIACLQQITGKANSKETLTYVERNWTTYKMTVMGYEGLRWEQ